MRVAIAVWNDRVSPVFDTSSRMLLVDVEGGSEQRQCLVELSPSISPLQRARRLGELEVSVLVCGAISRPLADAVAAAGMTVIPWISGPAQQVLEAYLEGRVSDSRWCMPGCSGRQARESQE